MYKKSRLIGLFSVVALAMIIGFSLPMMSVADTTGYHQSHVASKTAKAKQETPAVIIDRIHAERLPATLKTIDKALEAINAGDTKKALAELVKARKVLVAIDKDLGKLISPKFVNARCPIMDSPINPSKVSKKLTKHYKGQQVAFCCAGCPAAWDKLTEAEKDTKLKAVVAKQKPVHSDYDESHHKH